MIAGKLILFNPISNNSALTPPVAIELLSNIYSFFWTKVTSSNFLRRFKKSYSIWSLRASFNSAVKTYCIWLSPMLNANSNVIWLFAHGAVPIKIFYLNKIASWSQYESKMCTEQLHSQSVTTLTQTPMCLKTVWNISKHRTFSCLAFFMFCFNKSIGLIRMSLPCIFPLFFLM